MDFSCAALQLLLGFLILPSGYCLVCYDNVVAAEPVYIDCSFPGAACAVTNKTTTTNFFGYLHNESALLYHCAHKSRSCTSGPLNHCDKNKLGVTDDIHCTTWCCETDKCNLPVKYEMKVTPVPANDALSCYQLIGDRQERVKCLFDDAYCLFMEFGPLYSFLSTEKSATQLCSTKKHCDDMEIVCDQLSSQSSYSLYTMRKCSMKCCTTNYCNPLPWGGSYVDKPDPQHSNETSDQPNWFEQGTDDGRNVLTRTTTTTSTTQRTTTTKNPSGKNKSNGKNSKSMEPQNDDAGNAESEGQENANDPTDGNKMTFQPIMIIVLTVAFLAVLALIIVVFRQRQKMTRLTNRTDLEEPLRTNDYGVDYQPGSQYNPNGARNG